MAAGQGTILVVMGDAGLAQAIEKQLTDNAYQPVVVGDVAAGVEAARRARPVLMIVDRRLRAIKQIRAEAVLRNLPLIAFQPPESDCSQEECADDLELGADVVMCREGYRGLLARIRALLRREHFRTTAKSHYVVGRLRLDVERHEVTVGGRPVELTPKEFRILHELMRSPARVFTRDDLLNRIWGEGAALEEHTLDVHMHSLRRKIEADSVHPRYILTVRGVGYKLKSGN